MYTSRRSFLKVLFIAAAVVIASTTLAVGANVTLRWDANDPAPEGYRVFARQSGQSYDYEHPIWEDNLTSCTLAGLVEGVTYFFVVRAFDGDLESADSEEVTYTPEVVVPNQAPIANAGSNQVVYEGATVTLDGSGSSDLDGSLVAFQWDQTGGSEIAIDDAAGVSASFTAPVVGANGETLIFRLTVTDDDGSTSVANTSVSVLKSASTDVDGDGVPDVLDRFPQDPGEWADNDADGTGDNADDDDDNDGMTDTWELTYGLDPLTNDADLDADGDGVSNFDEYKADSNPTSMPSNSAPDAPVVDTIAQTERVGLTPVLVTAADFDVDSDAHSWSQWQISTEPDFSTWILDEISETQLTAYTVGDMVLDADTVYYWRVKFIDERNGASDWSQTATFTTVTVEASDDTDINGIPDAQEVDASIDVDEDGVSDILEANMMSVKTVEGDAIVGVESLSDNVALVSVKSLPTKRIADQSVQMGFGLIGFKLYLQNGVTTAAVRIHFDKRVSRDAKLYKYLTDAGWQIYENAVFAANRKSVTLVLEDGGIGDEDGVVNGVIVDPSGVAYTEADSASLSTGGTSSSSEENRSCFISTVASRADTSMTAGFSIAIIVCLLSLGLGMIFAAFRQEIPEDD